MKLPKFLGLVFSITLFALFYVYQQTEIYCLAYTGGSKSKVFQELLDKNNVLRYNINVITSLPQIGNKVLDDPDFEIPESRRLVRVNPSREQGSLAKNIPTRLAAIFDFFSLRSQAEARTINR